MTILTDTDFYLFVEDIFLVAAQLVEIPGVGDLVKLNNVLYRVVDREWTISRDGQASCKVRVKDV